MAWFRPLLGDLSGSIADNTYSRNRFGSYVRRRAIPVNPNSSYQSLVRAVFGFLSAQWRDVLTPTQRSGWEDYANNTPIQNSLGETIYMTGLNAFVRTNVMLGAIPTPAVQADPPDGYGLAPPPFFTVSNVAGDVAILTIPTPLTGGSLAIQVRWAGPFPQSRQFFKGPWPGQNKITLVDNADILAAQPLETGRTAGEKWFIDMAYVSDDGAGLGRRSSHFQYPVIVA